MILLICFNSRKMRDVNAINCRTIKNIFEQLSTKEIIVPRNATKKIIVSRIATVKSLNLRAECQGAILVVAIRGTLESGSPRGYSCCGKPRYWCAWVQQKSEIHLPVPIWHRQSPCSRRRIFLMSNFACLKPIRSWLFSPKPTTNGHSWHIISYNYLFNSQDSCPQLPIKRGIVSDIS
jgi:hypothetical protein